MHERNYMIVAKQSLLVACKLNPVFSRLLLDELPKVKLHNELVQTSVILLARTLSDIVHGIIATISKIESKN